jgi:hypothetical protein
MKKGNIIINCLGCFCAISAILTLVSYIIYEFFSMGSIYISITFFVCAMIGGIAFLTIGIRLLIAPCSFHG